MTEQQLQKFLDSYFELVKLTAERGRETAQQTEKLDKLEAIIRKGKAEHESERGRHHAEILRLYLPSLPVGSAAGVAGDGDVPQDVRI